MRTNNNYLAGSPLNRVSWLRPSHTYLNALVDAPDAKWILFNSGKPLVTTTTTTMAAALESSELRPVYLTSQDVKPMLGPQPYFGQGRDPGDLLPDSHEHERDHDQHSPTEAARHRGLRIVFLGIREATLDSTSGTGSRKPDGTPYFAVDASELTHDGESQADDELRAFLQAHVVGRNFEEGRAMRWADPLSLISSGKAKADGMLLDPFDAALFAGAKIMVDWNVRNKFCPACGSPTYSLWGGWKIACRSLLPWWTTPTTPQNKNKKRQCVTANGLHNFMHPRTDAVVIMIAIDDRVDKVLLGRAKKHPGNYYSAPAGFVEPGETLEDAVKREMWEETGVRVWNVTYHSGQPWPFPANLMLGFYARADSTRPIRLDLDNELVDARWFTRQEIQSVLLDRTQGTTAGFRRPDHHHGHQHHSTNTNTNNPSVVVVGNDDSGLSLNAAPEPSKRVAASTTTTKAATESLDLDSALASEAAPTCPSPPPPPPPFRLAPATAIAGVMIRDWVDGKIRFID